MSEALWTPDPAEAARSEMAAFQAECARQSGRRIDSWAEFQRFACDEYRGFWRLFLDWSGILCEGERDPVCLGDGVAEARFFPRLRLNWTENLLRTVTPGDDAAEAIVAVDENGGRRAWTRGAVREQVRALAGGLQALGLRSGDRVVAYARHAGETVLACLAATALGAAWSAVAPDLGVEAVLARFQQIEPVVLFAHFEHSYQGAHKGLEDRVRALLAALPSVRAVVVLDGAGFAGDPPPGVVVHTLDALRRRGASSELAASTWWPRFPFDHPLFVLFSSGTTGRPKCIVHGHGGTLLEHQKEHRLHSGFGPSDTLYFHTTAGWMMWNWLVSALACGTRIVLYDGSPTWPQPDALLRMLQREAVTVFGTSPAYVQYLKEAGLEPARDVPLPRLRVIQSTGSVLYDWLFHWLHEHVARVPVHSISGGTDILGCFVLGHPGLPVWAGESQCVSLAMDVRAAAGGVIQRTGTGELVCVNPFPSRPVGFLADPDGTRYRQTYYSQHEGAWTHGDFLTLYERGSARILGRSDGTLKIRGVRIGPAELYSVVMAMEGIVDAMALAQHAPDEPGGTRLVLLVVLAPGRVLDRPLTLRIKKELQTRASPVHVPAVIAQVQALPQTHNGKRSENAASDALHNRPVRNLVALRNPDCLEEIRRLGGVRAP